MKFSKNNSGFSLIEAMVGVAIISIMALTITRFSEVRKTSKVGKLSTSCATVAKSVVDYVKDASVSANFSSYFYGSDGGDYSTNAITNIGGRVNGADAWTNTSSATTPFFNLSGANAQTNTFLLMESSLRVLTSIYNSAGWVPNTFRAYAPITGNTTFGYIVDETQKNTGAAPTILISVTPYNIVTKDLILPPVQTAPLFIRPAGGAGVAPPVPVIVRHAATSRDDVGMRLGVEVRYTADGVPQSCQTSHDFQYPPDTSAPAIESLELTQNEYIGGGQNPNSTSCGAANDVSSSVQIRLNVSTLNFEEGLVFLCRDNSVSSSYPVLPGGPNYPANSGHIPCNVPPTTSPDRYGVGTDSTPVTEAPPSSAPNTPLGGGWTTCDQVTLCGVNISGFTVNGDPGSLDRAGAATNRAQLVMDYTLLAGTYCEFDMDAVAIDSAGNSSAQVSLTAPADTEFGTTTPFLPTHYTSDRDNITANGSASGAVAGLLTSLYHDSRPTFGKAPPHCTTTPLCTDPGGVHDWHSNWNTQFPDGYYTCAATCCEITPPVAPAVIPITGTTSDACHPYSP